jgi:hypothetical protein
MQRSLQILPRLLLKLPLKLQPRLLLMMHRLLMPRPRRQRLLPPPKMTRLLPLLLQLPRSLQHLVTYH